MLGLDPTEATSLFTKESHVCHGLTEMACALNQTYFEIMMADASCCDEDYVPPEEESGHEEVVHAEDEHHRRLGGDEVVEEEESHDEETHEEDDAHASDDSHVTEDTHDDNSHDDSHEASPVYYWNDLVDMKAILGHPLIYESHGHNYSYFSDYDNGVLLELYLSKVIFPRRRLAGGGAAKEEEEIVPIIKTKPSGTPQYTIQSLAFTFNNRELSVIEMQEVSKYKAPATYYILMSCILVGTLVVAFGIPITLALNDSYELAELINRRRFPAFKGED